MEYEIKNAQLCVRISSKGGEFRSIQDTDGREYLWQGDEATWIDRGPNLFPYIARMTDKSYTFQGKTWHMDIHGFLPYSEMELVSQEEKKLVMRLDSSPETLEKYPFVFSLEIQWELKENTLEITYRVLNKDTKTMYFGIGGHPGFRVPWGNDTEFTDYFLDFGERAEPIRVGFSDDCFVNGNDVPFTLRENRYLDLKHDLFDQDAIVLYGAPRHVVLTSEKCKKAIEVSFPKMPYIGFWHWPKTEVPYVCIEPWSSLPSRKGVMEDLEKQENLIALEAGGIYENQWSITLKETDK